MTNQGAYREFLDQKRVIDPPTGFDATELPNVLKPHQHDIVRWAIKRGRAAVFAATGLGKTLIELCWAHQDPKDEQHISPLQLDVIERCIDLWSNPGDVVLTPFLGIGSEVFSAVKMGRKGVGFELKPSYFSQAVRNLAEVKRDRSDLFAGHLGRDFSTKLENIP